jgi:hypothetical protein
MNPTNEKHIREAARFAIEKGLSIPEYLEMLQAVKIYNEEANGTENKAKGNQKDKPKKANGLFGRGFLTREVPKILNVKGKPKMHVADIFNGLVANGYKPGSDAEAKEAKKSLAIRIYKIPGVKKVGKGLFSAE